MRSLRYNMFVAGDCCCRQRFEAGERTGTQAVKLAGMAASNIARIAYQRAVRRNLEGHRGSWVARSDKGGQWNAWTPRTDLPVIGSNIISLGSMGQVNVFHKSLAGFIAYMPTPEAAYSESEESGYLTSCEPEAEGVGWKMGMLEGWITPWLNGEKKLDYAEGKTMDDLNLVRDYDYYGGEWKEVAEGEVVRGIQSPPPSPTHGPTVVLKKKKKR